MGWTAERIPDQGGRTAVVTGATSGLGLATATELARRGAHVVLTARSAARGEAALTELRRRVRAASAEVAELDLTRSYPGLFGRAQSVLMRATVPLLGQSGEQGALPLLRAGTDRDLPGGSYLGPGGPGEARGLPVVVRAAPAAYDEELAGRLWTVSAELTGVAPQLGPDR